MSKFIKKLLSTGRLERVKRNFRGRGGSRSTATVDVKLWEPKFIRAILRLERRALHYTGISALRKYKRMLGKKQPKQLTKRGAMTKRFKDDVVDGGRKYPYMKIGTLRNFANYHANEDIGYVIAGPQFSAEGKRGGPKTVPQLLNEGGTRTAKMPVRVKSKRKDRRAGRYSGGRAGTGRRTRASKIVRDAEESFTVRIKRFENRTVKYKGFPWTPDLRIFSQGVMIKFIRDNAIG